jgi:hypothetical protein
MATTEFKTRIIHKNDIEENWNNATTFIPMKGEIIVYNVDENYDYERIKVGDGLTTVVNLPFYLMSEIDTIMEKLEALENMLDVDVDPNLNLLIFSRPLSI